MNVLLINLSFTELNIRLTLYLIPLSNHPKNQAIILSLALCADQFVMVNYELFYIKFKRLESFANGHLECGLENFGEEMQIDLNKLVLRKDKCPAVVSF